MHDLDGRRGGAAEARRCARPPPGHSMPPETPRHRSDVCNFFLDEDQRGASWITLRKNHARSRTKTQGMDVRATARASHF
eukprot:9481025-Pyramimonas_sp.AAC.1